MVALADLVDLGGAFRSGKRRIAPACDQDRQPLRLIEISSAGFRACGPNPLMPGEAIRIDFPALGELNARVTWAKDHEFGAEFCGATDLRLLFLRKSSVECSSWFERRTD